MRRQLTLGLCALVLGVAPACHKKPGDGTSEAKGAEAPDGKGGKGGGKGRGGRRGGPQAVKVVDVRKEVLPRAITQVAILKGIRQADVYAPLNGHIVSLGAAEDAPVRKGEVLFRLDRNDPGDSFLNVPVTSPLSGWVGRWLVADVGDQVTTSQPVVTIVDDTALKATVYLLQDDWVQVKRGLPISVEVGSETRPASVERIARSGDAEAGRGAVTVKIANDGRAWRSGMTARVTFLVDKKPRLLLSASSLTITDKGAFVFKVVDGKAVRQAVRFRLHDLDRVEVLDGLAEGDRVVTVGGNLLADGSPVTLAQE